MRGYSFIILLLAVLISLMGVFSIYSSSYQREGELWSFIYKRQILWIIIGILIFSLLSNLNYRHLWDITYFLYLVVFLLLLLVFILGVIRLGAQRWIKIGWLNFQPSELAKLMTVIFLARYFSAKSISDLSLKISNYGVLRAIILPAIFIAIPVGLVIKQPDLGTGIIILLIFISLMYVAGIRLRYLLGTFLTFIIATPILWHFLRDYQKNRLLVFLNPGIDPQGAGYTVIQSKIAIGSGGIFGKGWLSGTQSQLRFLPESHTDFIFATFSEEWGLLGATCLLLMYYLLIRKGLSIALNTNDYFGRLIAFGITFMLAIQICINIAMNLGIAPVVGVPLPLMSYGGSSILVTFMSLGILVNIDKKRAVF